MTLDNRVTDHIAKAMNRGNNQPMHLIEGTTFTDVLASMQAARQKREAMHDNTNTN